MVRALPLSMVMTILDIAIIYLAFGSPFAVKVFLANRLTADFSTWLNAIGALITWPIIAFVMARRAMFARSGSSKTYHSEDGRSNNSKAAGKLIAILEDEWLTVFGESSLLGFREAAERYAGISIAVLNAVSDGKPQDFELLEISRHPDIAAGAACLMRRSLNKLLFHQIGARTAFVDVIAELFNAGSERSLHVAIELSQLLGDPDGVKEIAILSDARSADSNEGAAALEGALCNIPQHRHSMADPV